MALRKILNVRESALHKTCKSVTNFDDRLHRLLDDMKETLEDAGGVGLAAPQVGILRRVVQVDNGPAGGLSLPGKYGRGKRPRYAKVRAQDRNGNWFETDGEELTARCFCHELDHLDGIVYTEVMERFLTDEELEAE